MHRLFVTYKGQPLVVGTEDDLITIPEPGIEVNEILGSEEVTEKIAEDVAVGDVLYKYVKHVDILDGDPHDNFIGGGSFVEHEGDLYLMQETNDGTPYLYKYENSRWRDVLDGHGAKYYFNGADYGKVMGNVFSTSEGMYAICVGQDKGATGYYLRRYENGSLVAKYPIADEYHIDPSSVSPIPAPSSKAVLEVSGKIHIILPHSSGDGVTNGFLPYTYDPKTNKLTKTDVDLSSVLGSANSYGASYMVEYDGSIYCVISSTVGRKLFRYDPVDDYWYYLDSYSLGSALEETILLSSTTGLWSFGGIEANGYGGRLDRIDTSTGTFVQYPISGVDPALSVNSVGMWEEDGFIYLVAWGRNGFASTINDISGVAYVAKLDPATSSVTVIPNALNLRGTYNQTIGDTYHQGRFINYRGDKFISVNYSNLVAPHMNIFKWNSELQKFEDISYWAGLHGGGVRLSSQPSLYEYNGRHYYATEQYDEQIIFGEYITSGNPSGYFIKHNKDVSYNHRPYWPVIYESSSGLYCFTTKNDADPASIYKLDEPNDFWNKFDQSVTSSIPAAGAPYILNFSGQNFLSINHFTTAPYVSTYILDGSTITALPDVSSTATVGSKVGYHPAQLLEYNNELFMFRDNFDNGTDVWEVWKWDGANWQDVAISSNVVTRGYGIPYILSGTLNFVAFNYNAAGTATLWKYDGSGFDRDYNEKIPPMIGTYRSSIVKDDYVYIFAAGYGAANDAGLVRKPDGEWVTFSHKEKGENGQNIEAYHISSTGEIFLLHTTYQGGNQKSGMYKSSISEFFDERVWYQKPPRELESRNGYEAAGIALESGSKGDTIRIQKVKR